MKIKDCAGCQYFYEYTEKDTSVTFCCSKSHRSHFNPDRHKNIEIIRRCPK